MSKNFYISDLHFGHKNIIGFDSRPWNDLAEMEKGLINNWNSVVTKEDTVYILGDFCWSKDDKEWIRLLKSLNGIKVLTKGNHDLNKMPVPLKNCFADIKDYKEINDNGYNVILCHYPILAYKHSYDPFVFMLYGHVHNTKEAEMIDGFVNQIKINRTDKYGNRGQLINVSSCRSYMNYTPKTLEELINAGKNY